MQSPEEDLRGYWSEMQRQSVISGDSVSIVPLEILQMLFDDAVQEKQRIETDQIISRLMFKQCFNHIEEAESQFSQFMTLRKKFRYLALYYYRVQNYLMFGHVVISSIIREWPVKISYVHDDKPSYIWDRAPFSIAMKVHQESIRKDGDKYVMRVLALNEEDIGSMLYEAEAITQLLAIDEQGKECPTDAFIIELNREGGGERKREPPSPSVIGQTKRPRAVSRNTKNKDDALSPPPPDFFESGFKHEPSGEGRPFIFVGRANGNGKNKEEFRDEKSKNLIFTIPHISIIDPSTRTSITQKYLLKTHFEFQFMAFGTPFIVRTTDHYPTEQFDYQTAVRSMPFEVSSNASTHWKKSFAAIWETLYLYHSNLGELSQEELKRDPKEQGNKLRWILVKEMVQHFISHRSEFHIRPLMETEMRTVSRMILARRLEEYNNIFKTNKQYKQHMEGWIIDKLSLKDKEKIQDKIFDGKRIRRSHDTDSNKTFTQLLNIEMQSLEMHDNFAVKQTDFTENFMVLCGTEPEKASCSLFSWLHAVSEIIAGPTLHFGCPQTTIRMFNRHLITLRSAESAKRTVKKILELAQSGQRTSDPFTNVLMIRIDERGEFRLLLEMIDPSSENPLHRHYFGSYSTKTIKETKISLDKYRLNESERSEAVIDGVITKTRNELFGLFAVLKTGYLSNFHKICKSSEGKLIIVPIFKIKNSSSTRKNTNSGDSDPAYPYDFTPAKMVGNEINPVIGPMSNKAPTDIAMEIYSQPETAISRSMASMRLQEHSYRPVQNQHQIHHQPTQTIHQSYSLPSYSQEQEQQQQHHSPHFAYPMLPSVHPLHHVQIQNVHNVYYGAQGAPPPYITQSNMVPYNTQGIHSQTPPQDPVNCENNGMGYINPNYQPL